MVPTLATVLGVKGHRPVVGTRDCKDLLYVFGVINLVSATLHGNGSPQHQRDPAAQYDPPLQHEPARSVARDRRGFIRPQQAGQHDPGIWSGHTCNWRGKPPQRSR